MNLTQLVADMRAIGIKSLALELADEPSLPPAATIEDRPTLAPGDLDEPKPPGMCAAPGCGDEKRGLFGGLAGEFCRTHAMQRAGVRIK